MVYFQVRSPSPVNPEDELPPADATRNMVARFRDIQSTEDMYQDRKPVRKMTPPRDELAAGIQDMQSSLSENEPIENPDVIKSGEEKYKEEELPQRDFTKSMLAKFKSMEDTQASPPAPGRGASPRASTQRQSQIKGPSKSSPDSGISDSEGGHQMPNGHEKSEVVKEDDKSQEEKELPESGFTQNLLAQWRNKEKEVAKFKSPDVRASRSPGRKWSQGRPQSQSPTRARQVRTPESDLSSPDDHNYENIPHQSRSEHSELSDSLHEVIRESDHPNEEQELPPPAMTKNMLAKFQSLQDEAERDSTSLGSNKKVRSVPPPHK